MNVYERKTEMCSTSPGELVDIVDRFGAPLKHISHFKCLESVVCEGGGCKEDVRVGKAA